MGSRMNLMHSCRQAAELLTRARDEPLPALDKLRLKLHLSLCGDCRNVEDQLAQIGRMMRSPFDLDEPLPDESTPPGAKDPRGL